MSACMFYIHHISIMDSVSRASFMSKDDCVFAVMAPNTRSAHLRKSHLASTVTSLTTLIN